MNDQQLIAQIARRDTQALATLYDRHAPTVLGCLCRAAQQHEVETLVEDAFYQLWNQPQTVHGDLRLWLLQTACRCGRERGVNLSVGRIFLDYA